MQIGKKKHPRNNVEGGLPGLEHKSLGKTVRNNFIEQQKNQFKYVKMFCVCFSTAYY